MTTTTTMRGTALFILTAFFLLGDANAFLPFLSSSAAVAASPPPVTATTPSPDSLQTKNVVSRVAVSGATGRLGRLVVEELLNRGVSEVVAIVRETAKAAEVFPNPPDNLEIVVCDLTSKQQIESALEGVDAAIWCATGFSDAPGIPLIETVKRLLGIALAPKRSIDAVGLPLFANCLAARDEFNGANRDLAPLPKIVMCSSAGVTRPAWDAGKKERFPGAADIPIVRLNPFGILDTKRESEEKLRESGIGYCIVRPGGLNDKWPAGSRPVVSQGDVAVGRINRKDVADVLVDVLSTPEATGKTFELFGLAGYTKQLNLGTALSTLLSDEQGLPSMESIAATYAAMQQLLPGEQQDSAALAMGQTYEELDKGKTGRLGKRGEENAEEAAPKPSS